MTDPGENLPGHQNKNTDDPFSGDSQHRKIAAATKLLGNRLKAQEHHQLDEVLLHTSPAAEHYPHIYLWDSAFFTIMYSEAASYCLRHGEKGEIEEGYTSGDYEDKANQFRRAAVEEIFTVFKTQGADGFVSNIQFTDGEKKVSKFDWERKYAFEPGATGSNYSQPPLLALSAERVFKSMKEAEDPNAETFLQEIYGPLKKFYDFWDKQRSNGPDDKLIGIIHPHETGRDSDPVYDGLNLVKKMRIQRNGPEEGPTPDYWNMAVDYAGILVHGRKLKKAKGDIAKAKEIFWANDVMMNCIYADNLKILSRMAKELGKTDDAHYYGMLSDVVEQQIIEKMWFGDARDGDGAFLTLDKNENPIKEISVSNLFPITLPNLEPKHVESILNMLQRSFNTAYPLPSVATDSKKFDPHNREEHRLWRGPTWLNTNWYIVRGLRMQSEREDLPHALKMDCKNWADKIAKASEELLDKHGAWEHYDPITGQGQRDRVKDFGWSWLGYFMEEAHDVL